MMRNVLPGVLAALLMSNILGTTSVYSETVFEQFPPIHVQGMVRDIQQLSSSEFQGRQVGTEGGRLAAEFVANRFEHLGLLPGNSPSQSNGWYQERRVAVPQFPGTVTLDFSWPGDARSHFLSQSIRVGKDFLPVLDSPSVNLEVPLVFVGYGIVDPARGIDDYAGVDVRNRVVMFLRGKPSGYPHWVTHEEKERVAREKGASGFLTLTGPHLSRYEARRGMGYAPLALYSTGEEDRPLPGCWIKEALAEQLFKSAGLRLPAIQQDLDARRPGQSRPLPILVHLAWESEQKAGTLRNVLGGIPGSASHSKDEVVIIGAHRDHFGQQAGLLFPGADDNASGTSVLLEAARLISYAAIQPKRSILFVSFDGEEQGLLGSRFYMQSPTFDRKKIMAMINVDHVGVGNGRLTVGLAHLSKTVGQQAATKSGLSGNVDLYGYFPGGDHVPFAEAGIPTITIVSSGVHESFHQTGDTVDAIQPDILAKTVRYVVAIALSLANEETIRE